MHLLRPAVALVLIALVQSSPAAAQDARGSRELATAEELGEFLPRSFDGWQLDQFSPAPQWDDPPRSVTMNALYDSEQGDNSLFIGITQHRPGLRDEPSGPDVEEFTLDGHRAFRDDGRPVVTVWLGERIELSAYGASADDDLSAVDMLHAIDAVDLDELASFGVPPQPLGTPLDEIEVAQ